MTKSSAAITLPWGTPDLTSVMEPKFPFLVKNVLIRIGLVFFLEHIKKFKVYT